MSKSPSPQKLSPSPSSHEKALKSKLLAVNTYISRVENLPATLFMQPELLQYESPLRSSLKKESKELSMSQKYEKGIKNNEKIQREQKELTLYMNENLNIKNKIQEFLFCNPGITENKCFFFKVEVSKVEFQVTIFLDGHRKGSYKAKKTQGIIIKENKWKNSLFQIDIIKADPMGYAKIQITTMTTEFKSKSVSMIPQRKSIALEIEEYIKENISDGRINEILLKKKMKKEKSERERIERIRAFSESQGFQTLRSSSNSFFKAGSYNEKRRSMGSISPDPRIQSAQIKRDTLLFEDLKVKITKHIKKMKPEISTKLEENKEFYNQEKFTTVRNLSILTVYMNFFTNVHTKVLQNYKQKVQKMCVTLQCEKFTKNMSKLCKPKNSIFLLSKFAFEANVNAISCVLYKNSVEKAEKRILEAVKTHLFKLDFIKVCKKSLVFQKKVRIIQKLCKKRTQKLKIIFRALALELFLLRFESEEEERRCFRKYKKHCLKKGKKLMANFVREHAEIPSIVEEIKEKRREKLMEKNK